MKEARAVPSRRGYDLGMFRASVELEDDTLVAKIASGPCIVFDRIRFLDEEGYAMLDARLPEPVKYANIDVLRLALPPSVDAVVLSSKLEGLP